MGHIKLNSGIFLIFFLFFIQKVQICPHGRSNLIIHPSHSESDQTKIFTPVSANEVQNFSVCEVGRIFLHQPGAQCMQCSSVQKLYILSQNWITYPHWLSSRKTRINNEVFNVCRLCLCLTLDIVTTGNRYLLCSVDIRCDNTGIL